MARAVRHCSGGRENIKKLARKIGYIISGNRAGGLKTAETNKRKDPDHYHKIGRLGGLKSRGGGFAAMTPEQRSEAGRKGGKNSRKGKKWSEKNGTTKTD